MAGLQCQGIPQLDIRKLLLCMRNRLTQCINKSGRHYTRYCLEIFVIINMFMPIPIINKAGELGWPY